VLIGVYLPLRPEHAAYPHHPGLPKPDFEERVGGISLKPHAPLRANPENAINQTVLEIIACPVATAQFELRAGNFAPSALFLRPRVILASSILTAIFATFRF
jgi:hypothetical protein